MTMDALLSGRLTNLPPQPSKVVKVVLSCTKSDTEHERFVLLRDVVPEVQRHCQEFGLDFQLVDMHAGPGDLATNDHESTALRLKEITDAHRISQGPFFLSIITNKYGDYILPNRINGTEFSHIRDCAFEAGKDINILDEWYIQEAENPEQAYVLQPISTKLKFYYDLTEENKDAHEKDISKWKKTHDSLMEMLQQSSEYVHDEGLLNEEELHKYHISALENELTHALGLSKDASQNCMFIFRSFADLPQNVDCQEMHNYVDIRKPNRPKIYKKAVERIKYLKESSIPSSVSEENILPFTTPWTSNGINPVESEEHAQYLKDLCSQITTKLKELITQKIAQDKENARNLDLSKGIQSEVLAHSVIAAAHTKNFVSRESITNQVESLITEFSKAGDKTNSPVVLHGEPGSGKSAVVSQLAKMAPSWLGDSVIVVTRFIQGTTNCKTMRDLLEGICQQILEAYKPKKTPGELPREYEKLAVYFHELLTTVPNQSKPLFLLVDIPQSLSQVLTKEQLDWLLKEIPSSAYMVISVSDSPALKVLKERIPGEKHFIRVTSLNDRELSGMVKLFLQENSRTLTPDQIKIVSRAVARRPLPMFAKLMCHEAQLVNPSGNGRDPISAINDAMNLLFEHVEKKHGILVISHILRYLCAAHHGLTEAELLDLLSCNDELMAAIYKEDFPRIVRFPYRYWSAIRIDLGALLVEKHIDNKTLLCWDSSVVSDIARQRYLTDRLTVNACHRNIADLFLQTWVKEKQLKVEGRNTEGIDLCRKVAPQPLLYGETRYNIRRVSELWFHLAHCGDLDRLKSSTLCNFEYLLAKTHAMSIYQLLQDFDVVRSMVIDSEVDIIRSALQLSAAALTADPLQLAAELIGRLLPMKGSYPKYLESLVNSAMEWCEQFTRPLVVPLASWLPTPREPFLSTLQTSGPILHCAVSHDNQCVFCVRQDQSIAAYKVASQEKVWENAGHGGAEITSIMASYDNMFLVTAAGDKTAIKWCASKGEKILTFEGHTTLVTCVHIAHNNKCVITATADAKALCFQSDSGKLEFTLEGHKKGIIAMAVNSHDDVLVTASLDRTIRLWCLQRFLCLDSIPCYEAAITHMTVSANDAFIMVGYQDSRLQVMCLATGSEVHMLDEHKDHITGTSSSADGTYFALTTVSKDVYIYNLKTREVVQKLGGHSGAITNVAVTRDGFFVLTSSMDGMVRVWNLPKEPQGELTLNVHQGKVTCTALSKDANWVITGSDDCTLKLWNLEMCQVTQIFYDHLKPITCVALADDNSFAVSGSEDTTVRVWSIAASICVVTFTDHTEKISNIMTMSDNKRILSADYAETIKLWKAESGEILLSCSGPSAIVSLTPDNHLAISGDGNELMKIWSVGSGESVKTINHMDHITCLCTTKDSQFTITGSKDESLKIWETKTGRLSQVLAGHDDIVSCVTIADHNRNVISGSHDKTLIVWNMSTGEIEQTLKGHTDIVTSAKMTADGSIVVSGSRDGTVRVWAVPSGALITAFHMNIGVEDIQMSFDASHIVVRLQEGGCAPLLCLHNSPAADIKSQSQVDIDIREDYTYNFGNEADKWYESHLLKTNHEESSSSVLPIKPKPPLVHKQTSINLPSVQSRKSTTSAPDATRAKQAMGGKARQSYTDNPTSPTGKQKKNKKSGVCAIV